MSLELSGTHPNDLDLSPKQSPLSGSATTTTGNGTADTAQDEKEPMSSLSQKSSPRLPSILLSPSEPCGARPRSSEDRVSSVNLPKQPSFPSRQSTGHPSSLGAPRRRAISHTHTSRNDEVKGSGKGSGLPDDALLNFGIGEDFALGPEDPGVLADVERALKAKAVRDARSKSATPSQSASSSPGKANAGPSAKSSKPATSASQAFPVTPPRRVVSGSTSTKTPSPATLPRIAFPPYIHSPSRSLESISSEGPSGRSHIPILVSLPDGSSYLDWSGAPPEDMPPPKDRSFLGRTFSITRRKGKEKDRRGGATGRHSVDLGASQGDLHAAHLDGIRRVARRETLSRAEATKDELGRRYNLIVPHKPTGEPTLTILDVVKSRDGKDKDGVYTPWLAWSRHQAVTRQKANIWAITAKSVEDFLRRSGQSPPRSSFLPPLTPINVSAQRSHSPSYGLSSPFSSRSSISISPNRNDGIRNDRRRMELNRSFSANPVIEGVASGSSPISPTLSRSMSLTQAPTFVNLSPSAPHPRHSIDAVVSPNPNPATLSFPNLSQSPRTSLDTGSRPQIVSSPTRPEKESLKKRVRLSLSGDRFVSTVESRASTMSSLTNLFNVTPATNPSGASSSGGRLHLGVSNMFGMVRRSGDESGDGRNGRSRSSVSDERDSGEGTKSDDQGPGMPAKARIAPIPDIRGPRSRGKNASNTSDSDLGVSTGALGGRFSRKLYRSGRDRDRDRSAGDTAEDIRESISGSEYRLVDSLAAPGWTSKRGVRRARRSTPTGINQENIKEILQKKEEEEERLKEVYTARELMLIETNDHNRRIARLLKAVGASIREHELVQSEMAQAVGTEYSHIPQEIMDAIGADPATTLRHGKGWQAVEDSHRRFTTQQDLLASYLSKSTTTPESVYSSDLVHLIQESDMLWRGLRVTSEETDKRDALVKPALKVAVAHMEELQREYNETQILVETDYPEQIRIADLETIITESRSPKGWLEFAAIWIPEQVLEFIGGFIRFFGVPISEKFIRPFLWYFFRNRYYWKIYSTEPPPSERAWYTRLGYWVVILSILAWYTTA